MAFSDIPNETAPARLLIVEDDVLLASSLDELLSASGFEVVGIAGSAATAASLAGERHPQLALIDIRLVGPIDGIELACHFREQFRIPAIFLSGLADPETKERALLAKPLGFEAVPREPTFQCDSASALRSSSMTHKHRSSQARLSGHGPGQ